MSGRKRSSQFCRELVYQSERTRRKFRALKLISQYVFDGQAFFVTTVENGNNFFVFRVGLKALVLSQTNCMSKDRANSFCVDVSVLVSSKLIFVKNVAVDIFRK